MVPEIKHDLNVTDRLVCRFKHIVVRKQVVKLSHEGCQGMSKVKSFIQAFCWLPGINKMVDRQTREYVFLPSFTIAHS